MKRQYKRRKSRGLGDSGQISGKREVYWRYCKYAAAGAAARAIKHGVPCTVTAHDIDEMLVDQKWRCAVSGIQLEAPGERAGPFGPGLDRIVPELGYVIGNLRIVCHMVNLAMNKWGEAPLRKLVTAIQAQASTEALAQAKGATERGSGS